MSLFSEREGFLKPRDIIQTDGIDNSLRTRIWNCIYICFLNGPVIHYPWHDSFLQRVWVNLFNIDLDDYPNQYRYVIQYLKKYTYDSKWYSVYDLAEYLYCQCPDNDLIISFNKAINISLEKENSAYRLVSGIITKITSKEEINEIDQTLSYAPKESIKSHINSSLSLMSDRKSPDFRNSIKESISAVESLCQYLTGKEKATLGDTIKMLDAKIDIHPCLKTAFDKLYGYTSDADGIRHALLDKDELEFEDAKFMLVVCSAFINYAISKASKAGLI